MALSRMYWHCEMYSMLTEKHLRVFSAWARSTESCELYNLSHKASSCLNPSISAHTHKLSSIKASYHNHRLLCEIATASIFNQILVHRFRRKNERNHKYSSSNNFTDESKRNGENTVLNPKTNEKRIKAMPQVMEMIVIRTKWRVEQFTGEGATSGSEIETLAVQGF